MQESSEPKSGALRDRAAALGICLLILLAAFQGAAWLARLDWRLDLATHFVPQRALGLAIVGTLLVATRSYRPASVAGALLAIELAWLLPFYFGPFTNGAPPANDRIVYRGVTSNLLAHRGDRKPTVDYLLYRKADLIGVQEMTPEWRESLRELEDRLPHTVLDPRGDAFGVGLFSRYPIRSHEIVTLVDERFPTIRASIDFDGTTVVAIVTHPPPPVDAELSRIRIEHLSALADLAGTIDEPTIVMGDLNVTPWSPRFRDALAQSGLNDARLGRDLAPTWPALLGPLGIPIDHVLVSPDVAIDDLSAGSNLGSDHLPVTFDFRLTR